MKRDRFDDILRDKLYTMESDTAVPSWKQMQERMDAAKVQSEASRASISLSDIDKGHTTYLDNESSRSLTRKTFLKRAALIGAAAVLAVAVSIGWDWFYRYDIDTSLHIVADSGLTAMPSTGTTLSGNNLLQPTALSSENNNNPVLSQILKSARSVVVVNGAENSAGLEVLQITTEDQNRSQNDRKTFAEAATPPQEQRRAEQSRSASAATGSNSRYAGFDWRGSAKTKRSRWMASAYTGMLANLQSVGNIKPSMMNKVNAAALLEVNYNKNSMNFTGRKLNHKLPVSVGLNVRKQLTPRFGLETGLVYTYMESTGNLEAEFNYKYKQKLHYLGIPVSASYTFLLNPVADIYATGGFMMEKALSARGFTDLYVGKRLSSSIDSKLQTGGLLWSANAGVGVNFNILDNFGIYLEPGVNYYFHNPDQPISYRTANPWSFNLRAGFRVKF